MKLIFKLKEPHYESEIEYDKVFLGTLTAYVKGIIPNYITETMRDYETVDIYGFKDEPLPLKQRREEVLKNFPQAFKGQVNLTGLLVEQIPTNIPERLATTKPGLLEMIPSKM